MAIDQPPGFGEPQAIEPATASVSRKGRRAITTEARDVPTRGFPAMRYKFYCWLGMAHRVPKPNKAEREERAAKARSDIREERIGHLNRRVKRDRVTVILAVSNQNGGGTKTWSSTHLACMFAELTRHPVAYFEARRDSAVGIDLLGVSGAHTVSSRELYATRDKINNARDLYTTLSSNERYGVLAVKTDELTPDNDTFDREAARAVVQLVAAHVPFVVLDTGNYPTDEINLGMVGEANVGLYPTLPGRESLTLCRRTLENLERYGIEGAVKNRIFLVNMLRDGQAVDDFRERLGVRNDETVYGTPFDRNVDFKNEDDPILDLNLLDEATFDALLAVLIGIVDKAYEAEIAKLQDSVGHKVADPTPILREVNHG